MELPTRRRILAVLWLLILVLVARYALLIEQQRKAALLDITVVEETPELPDFISISQVADRKQAFFDYFLPQIEVLNQRIEQDRSALLKLANKAHFSTSEVRWIIMLGEQYRLAIEEPISWSDLDELKLRVDSLPASLVMTQAAIESAWGSSRFAREGHNFFGQWCFTVGCGIVPNHRPAGARHEVQSFESPQAALHSYFNNLNSHIAYQSLREIRAQLRTKGQPLHGCILAEGLSSYSERGVDYINEVRHFIRFNQLSPYGDEACQPLTED